MPEPLMLGRDLLEGLLMLDMGYQGGNKSCASSGKARTKQGQT